jgi:hypothetical protein
MALRLPSTGAGAPLGAALLGALVVAGFLLGPARAPAPGRETTLWLAVESAAGAAATGDVRERFRERFGHEPQGVLTRAGANGAGLEAPWAWTRLAAAARSLGRGGPYALQGALLGIAALAAIATLRARLGFGGAALVTAVTIVGTPLFLLPVRLEPRALELALAALAAAFAWHRRTGPAAAPEAIYRGEIDLRPSPLRWALSGAAFGGVAAASPAYLPLALPLVLSAPAERRGLSASLFALFAAASFGALFWFGGSPWEPLEPLWSPALLFWSGLGLAIGRGVGLLPYFFPVVLLVANGGIGEGKRFTLLAVVATLVAQLFLAPFDFVEGVLAPGNAWFLPPLALLLLACEQAQSRAWTVAPLVVAAPFLAPTWLAPLATDALDANALAREAARRLAPVVDLLPVASTLRHPPGVADLVRPELLVRGLAPGIAPARDGRLRLAEREATLLVVSNRPISSIRVELGRDAPASIRVRGGALANTTYRPSGDVAFDVKLARRGRSHPVWWSRDGAEIHELDLILPARPARPLELDVPFAHGVVPKAGNR